VEAIEVTEEELQTEADAVKRKRDEEISTCFERARENLNGLLRSKKQVIRDLAHELERLGRPVDHIAAEIVHELSQCEELSKSLIYSYLDEKYKDPSHASRRKGKKTKNLVPETGTESTIQEDQAELAAEQEVLLQADTSGHSIQQKQPSESDHAETETQQQPYNSIDCKHCLAKDARITDLEEAVRAHTLKSTEELMHKSTYGYQQFEFPVPFELLRRRMVFPNGKLNGPVPDRVWFNGKFNRKTGEVVDVRIGRLTETDTTEGSG
jgi:hypothetical protein